jgi:hypothetical protein
MPVIPPPQEVEGRGKGGEHMQKALSQKQNTKEKG